MAFANAGRYGPENVVSFTTGIPISGASATVYDVGTTTKATLYTDRTKATTAANPVLADSYGNLTFFADPGQYDLLINGRTLQITVPVDPIEVDSESTVGGAVNVKEFGAKGDGTTDDLVAINAAITAAGATGTVFFPEGSYRISATISTANPVTLQGANWHGSIIKPDSGITAISSTAVAPTGGFTIRDLFIDFGAADHASNVGIHLNGGVGGAVYWLIDHVRLRGGDNSTVTTLGKGILGSFALEGVIQNCRIEFFGTGIEYTGESNANDIRGCKIRQNNIGIDSGVGISGGVLINGCTIEGNSTGLKIQSGPLNYSVATHFENNSGSQIDVTVSSGSYHSTGCFYNFPINMTGTCHFVSVGDSLVSVVNNSAAGGCATIIQASRSNAYTTTGTGRFQVFERNLLKGPASEAFTVQGGSQLLYLKGGNGHLNIGSNNDYPMIIGLNEAQTVEAYRIIENGDLQIIARGTRPLKLFGGNTERLTVSGTAPTSGQAGILVEVNDGAATSLRQVTVGAVDSGGAGFRYLRVPN